MYTFSTAVEAEESIAQAICASGDVTPEDAEFIAQKMSEQWVHVWRDLDALGVQYGNAVFYVAPAEIQASTYSDLVNTLEASGEDQDALEKFWATVALVQAEVVDVLRLGFYGRSRDGRWVPVPAVGVDAR